MHSDPVSLKQKRFLQFRFHNTVFIVPSAFRFAKTKKELYEANFSMAREYPDLVLKIPDLETRQY
jgi:hypothetical protein